MTRNSKTGRLLVLAAVAATVVAAVACGSSASRNKTASSPPGGGTAAGKPADSSTNGQTLGFTGAQEAQPSTSGAAAPSGDAAPAGASSDSGALPLPDVLGRKMIMVSTLELAVDDVAAGFEDVTNIAAAEGGFIASSAYGHQGDRETASVTIRVPADRYQDALARVRKLGDVRSEDTNSNDVTQEYTDLQSRMRSLQAALQQYLQFLNRAGDIGQVLQVQDRINQTQAEIEQVQGRINLLNNQTDLATITAHLAPPVVAKQPKAGGARSPLEVAADAFAASLAVLKGIATVALAVAAFSWWLLPLAAAGWYFGRRQLCADRERRAAPPPAPPAAA